MPTSLREEMGKTQGACDGKIERGEKRAVVGVLAGVGSTGAIGI